MQKNNEDSESREKIHSKPKISQSNSGKNQQTKPKIKKTQLTTSQQPWLAKTKERHPLCFYCIAVKFLLWDSHTCTSVPYSLEPVAGDGLLQPNSQSAVLRTVMLSPIGVQGGKVMRIRPTENQMQVKGIRGSHGTDLFVDICVKY